MLINPPTAFGNQALLVQPQAAFFCSQSCPGDIILKAQDWANSRGPDDPPVIGGFHTTVERDVLRILLRSRTSVVIVLAKTLEGWCKPKALAVALREGTAVAISPFPNSQRRTTAKSAATRNRYILTQAKSVLFAYASPNGKTEALAMETAAQGKTLMTFQSPSNENLVGLGAVHV